MSSHKFSQFSEINDEFSFDKSSNEMQQDLYQDINVVVEEVKEDK